MAYIFRYFPITYCVITLDSGSGIPFSNFASLFNLIFVHYIKKQLYIVINLAYPLLWDFNIGGLFDWWSSGSQYPHQSV